MKKILFMAVTSSNNSANFCYKTADIWQIVGYVLLALKIVIPIILIILGSISFAKATISSDDKELKAAAFSLGKRILAGIVIFLIPTIIRFVFSLINGYNDTMKNDNEVCVTCLTNPKKCDTGYKGEIFK